MNRRDRKKLRKIRKAKYDANMEFLRAWEKLNKQAKAGKKS